MDSPGFKRDLFGLGWGGKFQTGSLNPGTTPATPTPSDVFSLIAEHLEGKQMISFPVLITHVSDSELGRFFHFIALMKDELLAQSY